MSILQKLRDFSIFINIFLFFIYILIQQNISEIPISFNLSSSISVNFTLNLTNAIITIVIVLIALGLTGTNILGSGINDTGVGMIIKGGSVGILWIVISLFSLSFLNIMGSLGLIIYTLLSMFYVLGFIEGISQNNLGEN